MTEIEVKSMSLDERIETAEAKAFAFGEKETALRRAFYSHVGGDYDYYFWCEAVLDEHVISTDGAGSRFAYPYTFEGVTPVFGDPIAVERQYIFDEGGEAKAVKEEEIEEETPETFETAEDEIKYAKAWAASEGNNVLRKLEMKSTDDEVRVGNYIVLFGSSDEKDLENEYFTKATELESDYTNGVGRLVMDWEHARRPDRNGAEGTIDVPGVHDVLAYADWKSAEVDETGIWVERVLNRSSKYIKGIMTLLEHGVLATSTMPVQNETAKAADGHIEKWPLMRDSFTVSPMEWRMRVNNGSVLEAAKSLAEMDPCFKEMCEAKGIDLDQSQDDKGESESSSHRERQMRMVRLAKARSNLT